MRVEHEVGRKRLWEVKWRFGVIGLLLFKYFGNKPQWSRPGYIFRLYSAGFFGFFGAIFGLIILLAKRHQPWELIFFVALLAICSLVYGMWAQHYFDKKFEKELGDDTYF